MTTQRTHWGSQSTEMAMTATRSRPTQAWVRREREYTRVTSIQLPDGEEVEPLKKEAEPRRARTGFSK